MKELKITTIAATKSSIACDRQFTYRENTKLRGSTKILEINGDICKEVFDVKKALLGFAGNADMWGEIVSWFAYPEGKFPKCRGIEFLLLTSEKKLFHGTNMRNWMLLPDGQFAIGSGAEFAMGAMTSGKTPLEAVKIASKHDPMTGMGFLEYHI